MRKNPSTRGSACDKALPFLFLIWALTDTSAGFAQEGDALPPASSPEQLLEEIEKFNLERKRLAEKEKTVERALEEQQKRMLEQQQKLQRQSEQIQEQQRIYEEQKNRLDSLRLQIEELAQPPIAPIPAPTEPAATPPIPAPTPEPVPQPAPQPAAPPPAPPPQPPKPAVSREEAPSEPVGQAPPEEKTRQKQVADILEQRGILTPQGTLVVEPSLQYTHSSVTRVALEGFTVIPSITIGAIDVRAVNRNTVNAALGLRYGLTNRFEMEFRLPYVSRSDTTVTRPLASPSDRDETVNVEGDGLGDAELGLHYQINRGGPGMAYYLANLRIKSTTGSDPFEIKTDPTTGLQTSLPTGSGFWGIQPSLTISLPSDPAVFFGNVSYLWNLERDVNAQTGKINPGDAFGLSFGMGFAINQNASFSLGYSHSSVGKTTQNGENIPGSQTLQIGSLLFGASHRVGKSSSFSVSLGAGITEDAPDVQISVRLPVSYRLY